jgi:gas vesicle protein
MAVATFDTLKFANTLKAAGVPDKQAEAQAVAFAEVIQINFKDLVTKDDLAAATKELKQDIADTRKEAKQDTADLRKETKQEFADVRKEIGDLRKELKQDIADLRKELKQDIADARKETKDAEQRVNARLDRGADQGRDASAQVDVRRDRGHGCRDRGPAVPGPRAARVT